MSDDQMTDEDLAEKEATDPAPETTTPPHSSSNPTKESRERMSDEPKNWREHVAWVRRQLAGLQDRIAALEAEKD